MREVDGYLGDLAERLDMDAEARADALSEIRSHLLTAVRERVDSGTAPKIAARQVLKDFGGPAEVAAALNRAHDASGGSVRLATVLATVLFLEADTRRVKLRLARGAVQTLMVSLALPILFIGLPTLGLYSFAGEGGAVNPRWVGVALLLVFFVASSYLVSERLDGCTLRTMDQIMRTSVAVCWASGLLCIVGAYYKMLNPGGFIETTPIMPALATGANPAAVVFPAIFFAIGPFVYTLYLRRQATELRRLRDGPIAGE